MAPYSLHRNPDIFKNPTKFDPGRWLEPSENLADMKKWFWAFSSGGRMCIGMQYVPSFSVETTFGFDYER